MPRLVVDRSGSMADPMAPGAGTKAQAVRSASRLFFDLMRVDVGDRRLVCSSSTPAWTCSSRVLT